MAIVGTRSGHGSLKSRDMPGKILPIGSRREDCQPSGTEKCNHGCARKLPSLSVINYEAV